VTKAATVYEAASVAPPYLLDLELWAIRPLTCIIHQRGIVSRRVVGSEGER